MTYRFKITQRPDRVGGVGTSSCYRTARSKAAGFSPPVEGIKGRETAIQSADDEAHAEDLDWVSSRSADSRVALWPSAAL